ncbi:MAG: ferrous iron transport protein B [Atopobiaceae bacterium]|nr:ferrous iron transport protein B [Atopobiaceae bacterium]
MAANYSIALLGQPNSGKSTLFNGLTGSHQRVGNWPGKTVEKKLGTCERDGVSYTVCDLPGTYSLSAMSEEERITQDYIAAGEADVVIVMVDASQLTRSMYMLADYAGARVPCVLVLNMMDVAEDQGKRIDANLLEQRLGIPVVPFVANDPSRYGELLSVVRRAADEGTTLSSEAIAGIYAQQSPEWREAYDRLAQTVGPDERFDAVWQAAHEASATHDGAVTCGSARLIWVDQMVAGIQSEVADKAPAFLTRLDKALMSARWGQLVGILVCLGALLAAMVIGAPLMMLGQIPVMLSEPIATGLTAMGAPAFIVDFIASGFLVVCFYTLSMGGFVFGVALVFGLLDEIGLVARISYLFDGTMSKLGLPGKVMMPFLSGFGCNIASVTGMRVVDSWGQRVLAIALSWAVPCGSTLSVIPTIAYAIFGFGGMFCVLLLLAVGIPLVMLLTARVFGDRLAPKSERAGLIMELPPYHKPHIKPLLALAFRRYTGILKRAFKTISVVALVFWAFSYSASGVINDSIIYTIGTALEPVSRFFGMGWKLFMAFLAGIMAKESVLGALAALYGSAADATLISAASGAAAAGFSPAVLATQVAPAEAMAFLSALMFNIPCVMVVGATHSETHSLKWTVLISLFYFCLALCISFCVYHVCLLVM